MAPRDYQPGERAARADMFEELNVFGTPTGRLVLAAKGDALPDSPRGFSWQPLSERSVAEIRARAAEYRRMAGTARTLPVRDSLHKIAERLDGVADQRERKEQGQP